MNSAHEGQQLYKIAIYICASSSQDMTCMYCYLVLCTSSLARTLLLCTQCHDVGEIRKPHRQLTGYKGQGPHTSELSIFLHGSIAPCETEKHKIKILNHNLIANFFYFPSIYIWVLIFLQSHTHPTPPTLTDTLQGLNKEKKRSRI